MTTPHDDVPRYRNPVLDEDRPDPDAIRVGEDYFLVTSSFNRAPGLPVLTSTDLVNWTLLTHALPGNVPQGWFDLPRHGGGVWAPSIRHHDGLFHIVYPDPDRGILVVSAEDAAGPWSEPRMLLAGAGIIDPCPLWDADGSAYLVHGWARSRAGVKNQLWVAPVDAALTMTLGATRLVIDGDLVPGCTTLEGPKLYRRDDWYWIFAPAGGVATGWQSVFRSRDPYGPYEHRVVLSQGATDINGPHQGAWVDAVDGTDWFLHFQDRGPFGRVLHLQPMTWTDDGWPLMGKAVQGGPPEPVTRHPAPFGAVQRRRTLVQGDDFASGLGPNWTWQANARPGRVTGGDGLDFAALGEDAGNLRTLPGVVGQPLPGLDCRFEATLDLTGPAGTRAGLAILGRNYLWAGLRVADSGIQIIVASRTDGDPRETVIHELPCEVESVGIRLSSERDGRISVAIRQHDGWRELGDSGFIATEGQWIGAEIAMFAAAPLGGRAGRARFQNFRASAIDEIDGGDR